MIISSRSLLSYRSLITIVCQFAVTIFHFHLDSSRWLVHVWLVQVRSVQVSLVQNSLVQVRLVQVRLVQVQVSSSSG
jgi:hypothetical protein